MMQRPDPRALAAIALTLLSLALFSGAITDIDFWWHINSGRWIWENGTLPSRDPLGLYPAINYWGQTLLQGQWAGQLSLFLVFDRFGPWGIIALRILVLGATLGLVAWRLGRTGAPRAAQALALIATATLLAGFTAERPQLFSLLFFAALLVVLEKSGEQRPWQWAVPLLLAVWTNFHQAVLLGALVAALHLALQAWEDWRAGQGKEAGRSALAALAALVAPLATPNGWNGIGYVLWLEFLPTKERISEYASPLRYFASSLDKPHLLVFFVVAALLLVTLLRQWRERPRQCLIPALLLVAGVLGYRYTPFTVIGALPLVLAYWPLPTPTAVPARLQFAGGALLAGLVLAQMLVLRAPLFKEPGVSSTTMPVALEEEAKRQGATGKIFSTVGWGGYLAWQLEGARPFIDGRYLLVPERLENYTHMLWLTPRGRTLFEAEGFDWVLMPHRNLLAENAQPYPLIAYLRSHPAWQLRLETTQGVLFSRAKISPP